MNRNKLGYTEADFHWAENFEALFNFIERFGPSEQRDGGDSQRVTLLLSTCRNSYMTVNAMFTDLQKLLGDSQEGLRSACELLAEAKDFAKLGDRFGRSMATVVEFKGKDDVWRQRHEIRKLIDVELNKVEVEESLKIYARLDKIINGEPALTFQMVDGRRIELLALDLTEKPHLRQHYEQMREICRILGTVAELGISYSIARVEPSLQLDLLGARKPPKAKASKHKEPSELALELAELCEFGVQRDQQQAMVQFGSHYRRPSNYSQPDPAKIPLGNTSTELSQAAKDYSSLMREALYLCHGRASNEVFFRPNVAEAPMPPPFVLDLPPPLPEFGTGRPAKLQVAKRHCATTHTVPNSFKLAMARLAVPQDPDLNLPDYKLATDAKPRIEADVRKAIQFAAANGCAAITFPEYSIPLSMREQLQELANSNGMVLIGGFEGQWSGQKLVDEVFVAIPGEPQLYRQVKQCPSNEEQRPEGFFRDDSLWLFKNSPIGDFSVIACSDFMELETLQAWTHDGPLPDVLFVIARNTFPDLYKHLAVAQSLLLYCALPICNIHDKTDPVSNSGSCLVLPKAPDPIDEVGHPLDVDGHYLHGIMTFDVPVEAIRARGRGKPSKGFLAVPKSAQRS